MHRAFYQARDDAGAVVHLHSTQATAVSCLPDVDQANPIPPLTPYFVMRVGRRMPIIPYYRPGDPAMEPAIQAAAQRRARGAAGQSRPGGFRQDADRRGLCGGGTGRSGQAVSAAARPVAAAADALPRSTICWRRSDRRASDHKEKAPRGRLSLQTTQSRRSVLRFAGGDRQCASGAGVEAAIIFILRGRPSSARPSSQRPSSAAVFFGAASWRQPSQVQPSSPLPSSVQPPWQRPSSARPSQRPSSARPSSAAAFGDRRPSSARRSSAAAFFGAAFFGSRLLRRCGLGRCLHRRCLLRSGLLRRGLLGRGFHCHRLRSRRHRLGARARGLVRCIVSAHL